MLIEKTNLIHGVVGSGKTKGILFNEFKKHAKKDESLLIIDSRGEYYNRFCEKLKDNGYKVYLINLSDPTESNGWNPLLYPYMLFKSDKLDECYEIVNKISHEICRDPNNGNADPFWETASSDYLSGIIITLFKKGNLNEINLGSVMAMINQCEEIVDGKTLAASYFDKLDPLSSEYILVSSTVYAPTDTRLSILSVLKQKLSVILMRPQLLNMLYINEINISKFGEKIAIFINEKKTNNHLASIFIEELVTFIKLSKQSFTFILDNLDNLPKLHVLDELLKEANHYDLNILASVNDINEMTELYGKYVIDRFRGVIDIKDVENLEFDTVEAIADFPTLSEVEKNYISFKKLIS